MANRDYINRNNKNKINKFSVLDIDAKIVSTILCFVLGLGMISMVYQGLASKDNGSQTNLDKSIAQKEISEQNLNLKFNSSAEKIINFELPSLPKEKSYISELENKEVVVNIVENLSTKTYQMQCASLRRKTDALKLQERIRSIGLTSELKISNNKHGTWYRIVLGPYKQKRKAEKDRHKLQAIRVETCQIWFLE